MTTLSHSERLAGRHTGLRNPQIPAIPADQKMIDLSVSRDGRCLIVGGIEIQAVFPALAQQLTSVMFQMPDQVISFHGIAGSNGSRENTFPAMDRSASSRFASSTICTAS